MKHIYIYAYERGAAAGCVGGKVKMFGILRDKGEDLLSYSSVQDGMLSRFYAILQLVIEPATPPHSPQWQRPYLQAKAVSQSFQL